MPLGGGLIERHVDIDPDPLTGHADVAFTMKQYVQTDLEADRQVATTLAELIIGWSLTSFEITGMAREAE
jgi:hypothetical protein